MKLCIKDTVRNLINELPEESVKVSDTEVVKVDNQKAIITEFEGEIAVGYTVDVRKRVFNVSEDKTSMTVTEDCDGYGEYKCIPKDSTLEDIVKTINEIVDGISAKLFGEA